MRKSVAENVWATAVLTFVCLGGALSSEAKPFTNDIALPSQKTENDAADLSE